MAVRGQPRTVYANTATAAGVSGCRRLYGTTAEKIINVVQCMSSAHFQDVSLCSLHEVRVSVFNMQKIDMVPG